MPIPALKSVTKGSGVSVDKAEKIWKSAVKNAPDKVKNPYAYAMGAVKNATESELLINKITEGESITSALDALVYGDSVQVTHDLTFISVRESAPFNNSAIRTYFDSYGELRFTTMDGVLINEMTPMMLYIKVISEVLRTDHELTELLQQYEGSVEYLHKVVTTHSIV